MSEQPNVTTTIKVTLEPWSAPYYAYLVAGTASDECISVWNLSDEALEQMAYAWLLDLYAKANRNGCPFRRPSHEPQAPAWPSR